jgi:hypothetical protein
MQFKKKFSCIHTKINKGVIVNLDQLVPERVKWIKEFEFESQDENGEFVSTSKEIEFNFRPFDVEDESWLKRAFGDKMKELLEACDIDTITRMGFHQLEANSKKQLMAIKFMDVNEDGEDFEICKKGPQKLGKLLTGYADQYELLQTLLKTRGFSMPIIEEVAKDFNDELGKQKAQKSE